MSGLINLSEDKALQAYLQEFLIGCQKVDKDMMHSALSQFYELVDEIMEREIE